MFIGFLGCLKEEIYKRFDILVEDQTIEGWFKPPENDETILCFCTNPLSIITHLTVKTKSAITSNSSDRFSSTVIQENESKYGSAHLNN